MTVGVKHPRLRIFRQSVPGERAAARKVHWPAAALSRTIWRELLFGCRANSGQNLFGTAVIREAAGFSPVVPCEDRKLWLTVACRERPEAQGIRHAAELARQSQEARGESRCRPQLSACRPMWWDLKKRLARVAEP